MDGEISDKEIVLILISLWFILIIIIVSWVFLFDKFAIIFILGLVLNLMEYIFETVDKIGKKIHLSKERWGKHIRLIHPEIREPEEIKEILKNPM